MLIFPICRLIGAPRSKGGLKFGVGMLTYCTGKQVRTDAEAMLSLSNVFSE